MRRIMVAAGRAAAALAFAGLAACAQEPDSDVDTSATDDASVVQADAAPVDAIEADPIEAPTEAASIAGERVVLARFHGVADPSTNTMTISRVEDTAVGSVLRTISQASWCSALVVQDGVSGSSPPDTLELESDPDTVASARPGEPTPAACVNDALAVSRPIYDDLYPVKGIFCGDITVRNFYGRALDSVHIEIRYSGDPAHQPYQYPYGNGADPTVLAGRFAPSAADGGLFRVGDLEPAEVFGDTAVVQFTFENGTDAAFEFEGEVAFLATEDCDNATDDDCDGVVNNSCGTFEEGDPCYADADCFSGRCIDGFCDGGCPDGLYGADCDPCPGGRATPCNDNGTCDDGADGTGLCTCDPGFAGAACDACEPGRFGDSCVPCPGGLADICGGNGTCDDGIAGTGACTCDDGFTGASCNSCAAGFYGPSCTACPDCGANGTCAEGIAGAGTCVCAPGFTGDLCDACTVDRAGPGCTPCPGGVGNACNSNGTCDSGIGGTGACACDTAWSGTACDECAAGYYGPSCVACPGGAATPCSGLGTCNDGRLGDGTCDCDPGRAGADCTACAPGYYGLACNVCPPCGPNGSCDDGSAGSGVCVCEPGWAGAACDSCAPGFFGPDCLPCRDCGANGTCRDGIGGDGSCACAAGFTGIDCNTCLPNYFGPTCEACPNCGSNGTCDDGLAGGGACACAPGWTGALCNTCAPGFFGPACDACPNCGVNGTCRDGLGGNGTCACAAGWTGARCNLCAPGFYGPSCTACPACGANGACSDGLAGDGTCVCDPGFHGASCQFSCTDGVQNGDETGVDCGGSTCSACSPLGESCAEILAADPGAGSGVYLINPGGTTVAVYCDMTADGGGWTLVGNTRGTPLQDRGGAYYPDLGRTRAVSAQTHIWDGLRTVVTGNSDIRFSCRTTDRDGAYDVDLSFYDIGWYRELTASTSDAAVCFEEGNGAGDTQPTPRRRNNLNGQVRASGDQWNAGYLEGEDFCGDTSDFTVDFDDRGMDSNQTDGTDWGADDGARKCGSVNFASGNWQVWVREPSAAANTGRSCQDILARNPGSTSGVYQIDPEGDGRFVDAYCDMTTDGGGWTLVANTRNTTLDDRAGVYYDDLGRSRPLSAQNWVWTGMRSRITDQSDIRFTCRNSDRDGAFTVDLSFYGIHWYREITDSTSDSGVCFEEQNGAGDSQPEPARRNNLNGQFRAQNDSWNWGYLEGEDSCGDTGDFTVDFDDRGMDSNQSDGTDWGEDDGSRKCGTSGLGSGNWQIWTREIGADATPAGVAPTCNTYTASSTTYRWLTPSSWTTDSTSFADDSVGPTITLPFTFGFFGSNFTTVRISSNGFVYLGSAGGTSGCCNGGPLPSAATPNGMIAGYWNDLNPASAGTIRYGTYGTAPNRIFIVEFSGVREYAYSNMSTFQIQLEETTNQVAIMCSNCSVGGHNVTQGIENAAGTAASFRAGRVASRWNAFADGTRFTPSCGGGGGGGVAPGAPAVCSGPYRNLTRADRNRSFNDGNGNIEFCESWRNDGEYTGPGWYRFSGAAGTRMPTTRPNYYDCGTDAPGWLAGTHPSIADGVVTRRVCYYWSGNSCLWSNNIRVANCGGFYLYELQDTPVCALRYCGE